MSDGALQSDHVNYLIFRYLQESGFQSSAESLYREWNRPDSYRNPEQLPFAPLVAPHELVHIIQDGLFHDQLQASVANTQRRFHLTSTNVDFTAARNVKPVSRRQSVYTSNDRNDFPNPPPKRVRQSNASDVVTNGDAMDIDDGVPDDKDTASPASEQDRVQSDVEVRDEAPISLKTATTQTDKRQKLKSRTFYWTVDNAVPRQIMHTLWSPSLEHGDYILTTGDALCRLYNLTPLDARTAQDVDSIDAIDMGADHIVTAVAWHPTGSYFTCAVNGPAQLDTHLPHKNYIVDIDASGDRRLYDDWFNMVTIALRYTDSGKMLFSVSTNGAKSVLEARDLTTEGHRGWPTASQFVQDHMIVDIACISESSFAVCGAGHVSVWSVEPGIEQSDAPSVQKLKAEFTIDTPDDTNYEQLTYDSRHQILVAASFSSGTLYTLHKDASSSWIAGPTITLPKNVGPSISAIAFQHDSLGPPDAVSRLAIAFASGQIVLYDASAASCTQSSQLLMGMQEPPLALAWCAATAATPARLAAAGDEAIKIWDVQDPARPAEVLAWKAAPAKWYQGDDNHLPDDEDVAKPLLRWDARGERLAFAVGRKMAIVSIMPEQETPEPSADGEAQTGNA